MNVNIQTVHFDADSRLTEYVTKKLEKLSTFHDRIVKVDVYLKLIMWCTRLKTRSLRLEYRFPAKTSL